MDYKFITVITIVCMSVGYGVGTMYNRAKHIKPEYYIELKPNKVLIEDLNGNLITCPIDKVSEALLEDNL